MAAITGAVERAVSRVGGGAAIRTSGTSTANQADTLTTTVVAKHHRQRISYVACVYSAAPTQAGVTVSIASRLGSTFNVLLSTGSANVQTTIYIPDSDIWLFPGDAIVVAAPAAGGVITSAISIVVEEL